MCESVYEEINDSLKFAKPYYVYNGKKFALTDFESFGHNTKKLISYLNSSDFVNKLEMLTGIKNLISDPSLEGGGIHFSKKDGYLKVHADFESHIIKKTYRRRLNLLIYFNKGWEEHNNGSLELYNSDLSEKITYLPNFNRAILFKTDSKSWHGHPNKLSPPENDPIRKSIALYYYTDEGVEQELKETNFKSLKSDNISQRFMMRFDQFLLRIFSFLKRKGVLSDQIVTKIINIFIKSNK